MSFVLKIPSNKFLIELHNRERKKSWFSELPILVKDDTLEEYAYEWVKYMAAIKKLKHSKIKDIMQLGFSAAGENIAYGQKDEESVMKTWMRSFGHRRNIMSKSYNRIGCASKYSEDNVLYWCVCFGKK